MFPDPVSRLADDQVRTSYDVVQTVPTPDFRQVFAHLLGQESEEVHQILAASAEDACAVLRSVSPLPTGQVFW